MRLAIRTITVYLRVLVVLLVVGAIGLILFNNRSYTVNVWLFGLTDAGTPVNVVWVMLATAVSTLAAWWIVSLGRGLVHDLREVRRERDSAQKQKLTEQRVAELDARQRRVEDQLKHSEAGAPQNDAELETSAGTEGD